MTTISVIYPNKPGSRFDVKYYTEKHMPLAIKLLKKHPGYLGISVERGVGGAMPGTDAAFAALCHFKFKSAEDFQAAFGPHAEELLGDIPNYTDIEPIIQVNEVMIAE